MFILTYGSLYLVNIIIQDMTKDLLPAVILFIFQGLQDEDDDVRAVAAAALVPVAEDLVLTMPQLVRTTVKPVLSKRSRDNSKSLA